MTNKILQAALLHVLIVYNGYSMYPWNAFSDDGSDTYPYISSSASPLSSDDSQPFSTLPPSMLGCNHLFLHSELTDLQPGFVTAFGNLSINDSSIDSESISSYETCKSILKQKHADHLHSSEQAITNAGTRAQLDHAEKLNGTLQSQIAEMQEKLAYEQQLRASVEQELAKLRKDSEAHALEIANRKKELTRKELALAERNEKIKQLTTERNTLQANLAQSTKTAEEFQQKNVKLQKTHKSLEDKLNAAQDAYTRSQRDEDNATSQNAYLQKRAAEQQLQLTSLEEMYKRQLEEQKAAYEAQLADMKAQHEKAIATKELELQHRVDEQRKEDRRDLLYQFAVQCESSMQPQAAVATLYKEAAELGHTEACYKVAMMHYKGEYGQEMHRGNAVKWLEQAVAQGHKEARYYLAHCLICGGKDVKLDAQRGVELVSPLSEEGHIQAMTLLGECLLNGMGVKPDAKKAIKLFKTAARKGDVRGECRMADCILLGIDKTQTQEAAMEILNKHQRNGDLFARCLYWNQMKEADQTNMLDAANAGEASAMVMLGVNLLKSDVDAAVQWLQRAADCGELSGLYSLGRCYLKGWGVQKDVKHGLKILLPLVHEGDVLAKEAVAQHYLATHDYSQKQNIISYLHDAAEGGIAKAACVLGHIYAGDKQYKDFKIPINKTEAKKYLQIAKQLGCWSEADKRLLDQLNGEAATPPEVQFVERVILKPIRKHSTGKQMTTPSKKNRK